MIERKRTATARVGIFAVAHGTYWEQFEGLLDNIMGYHADFQKLVAQNGVEVIDFGMVDTSEKAFAAAEKIAGAGLDLLFCNMVTYATSSVFAPVLRAANVPIVLAALQPRRALDYSKASTFMQLENDNICSVPEFTGVAIRLGKPGGGCGHWHALRRFGRTEGNYRMVPRSKGAKRAEGRENRPDGTRVRGHVRHARRPDGGCRSRLGCMCRY